MNLDRVVLSERLRGKGVGFERIRRITGYLVGTLDRFNSGKREEEHDRVKHTVELGMEDRLAMIDVLDDQEMCAVA